MADKPNEKPEAAAPAADAQEATAKETKSTEPSTEEGSSKTKSEANEDKKSGEDTKATEESEKPAESATEKPAEDDEKPAVDGTDTEMKDATEEAAAESSAPPADAETAPASETPVGRGKGRRKSAAGEAKGKALNRKGSKAKLTHLDAKPGDHFLVKLKGFPAWPAIICDESMLPHALVNSRPVTAARPDGTFAEAYADGGKRAHDRSFPVMYLHTNEFGWVSNTNLTQLTPEKAEETVTEKMRKDLKEAFHLAAADHPVEYYKDILKKFQDELVAQEEARKEAAATPKKPKKGKSKAASEDLEMADADDAEEKPKSKKRKADEDVATPQRSDSVKKPKIKLTMSTPKPNGTPKGKEESVTKPKSKSKKSDKKTETPKESKLTPEERRNRKEKEVLYLRHKLQRGLLTRDQQPQEAEMEQMSGYITLLENFQELEVSIIRATKINKVLKAILKLESIPREEEFHFKDRSQTLLDKWNKLMTGDSASTPTATNGVNGKSGEKKSETNGVKEDTEETKKEEPAKTEAKSEAAKDEKKPAADEAAAPPEPVETAA